MAFVEFQVIYGHVVSEADARRKPSIAPGLELLAALADGGEPYVGSSGRDIGGQWVSTLWVGVVLGRITEHAPYTPLSDLPVAPNEGLIALVEAVLARLPDEAIAAAMFNPAGTFLVPAHR